MTADHPSPDHAPVDCSAALEQLFDFLDGELDDALETRLKAHVSRCRHCFETADFERRFLELVQKARDEARCPQALRDRVLSTLRAEGIEA